MGIMTIAQTKSLIKQVAVHHTTMSLYRNGHDLQEKNDGQQSGMEHL